MKITLLTLSLLVFIQISYTQNSFSAKLTIPQEVLQGEYTEMFLDIYKPEGARNYTVFTQELPAGFFVKVIDAKGATHTFENNILTLTWMRCPADSKISIKYQIASMVGVSGKFNLSGKLIYMVGSKQGTFNLKSYILNVVKEKTLVLNNQIPDKKINEKLHLYKPINTSLKDVSCKRTVVYNKKRNTYDVEITLEKNTASSFSIVEKIPNNFKFSEVDIQESKVKKQSDLVQFLWVNLPKDKGLKVKYKLTPKENNTEAPIIRGKLSFLKNGQILNMPITNQE